MKVAILSRNFSKISGGAESFAVQLATAMRGECDITVISQSFDVPHALFRHIPVPKLPIRSRWINQLWFSWFSRRVSRQGFDIVHSHENVTHGNVHTVHVKTVHASLNQKGTSRLRILFSPRLLAYLWIEKKRLCSAGHQNVFVSQMLLDETRQALPKLSSGTFIPPGVALPDHTITLAERAAARRALELSPDRMVIGFVGHDFKKKGLDALLKAAALLPFDVQLLVIGNPAQAGRYRDQAQALGPGKECRFLGVVHDMSLVYAAIDCLAHPTTQDVFPMVLLEAMAHGVPVITTVAPFNSMASLLVSHKEAVLLADPHDHEALAMALERVGVDADLRQTLIDNGRRFAQNYSWSAIKNRYYAIYRTAIAASTRPAVPGR
jgi:UDP-glucose:(heptosyl)LPS alpha-1,3-glucosyltransferase